MLKKWVLRIKALIFRATGKGRGFFIAWGRASELNYQLGLSVLQGSEMTGQEGLIPGWGTGSVLRILPHYQVILHTDCLKSIVPHKWAVRARCWWNQSVNPAPRMIMTPPFWYSRLLKSRWGPACVIRPPFSTMLANVQPQFGVGEAHL